jgi:branched-chain amino acid transport system permease protein
MLELLLQGTANGLVTGAVFAVIAVGLTLVFGVMRIVNFAHGEFLMIAMYITYLMATFGKLNPYLAILVSVPLLFLLGAGMFGLLIRPLLAAPEISQLLMTMGVSILLQNLALLIFKGDPLSVIVPWSSASVRLGPVSVAVTRLVAAAASLVVVFGIYWLLKTTDLGRMLRAAAQNRDAAQLMGINVTRMYMLALAIGVSCLGVVGPVLVPWAYVSPDVGAVFTLTAFVTVVLGGMGSVSGAFFGGLILGVVSSVSQMFMPGTYGLIPQYLVFILLLLFRPEGLFSGRI